MTTIAERLRALEKKRDTPHELTQDELNQILAMVQDFGMQAVVNRCKQVNLPLQHFRANSVVPRAPLTKGPIIELEQALAKEGLTFEFKDDLHLAVGLHVWGYVISWPETDAPAAT